MGILKTVDIIGANTKKTSQTPQILSLYVDQAYNAVADCDNRLQAIKHGRIKIIFEETRDFWSQMISNIEHHFFTTNYSMFEGSYGRQNLPNLIKIQETTAGRLRDDNFERLFIYENEDELSHLQQTIKAQKEAGIKILLLEKRKYDELAANQGWLERIGSKDYSIIDGEYLYLSHIKDGIVTHAEMIRDGESLKAATKFTRIIKDYARET